MAAGARKASKDRELAEILQGLVVLVGWQQQLLYRALQKLPQGRSSGKSPAKRYRT